VAPAWTESTGSTWTTRPSPSKPSPNDSATNDFAINLHHRSGRVAATGLNHYCASVAQGSRRPGLTIRRPSGTQDAGTGKDNCDESSGLRAAQTGLRPLHAKQIPSFRAGQSICAHTRYRAVGSTMEETSPNNFWNFFQKVSPEHFFCNNNGPSVETLGYLQPCLRHWTSRTIQRQLLFPVDDNYNSQSE
jgi:hypothetical protein